MKVKGDVSEFFKVMKEFVNEAVVAVESGKMKTRAITSDNVAYIELVMNVEHEGEGIFAVDVDKMSKVKADELNIENGKAILKSDKIVYELSLFDPESVKRAKEMNLENRIKLTVNADELMKMMKAVNGSEIEFANNKIVVKDDYDENYKVEMKLNDENEQLNVLASTEYVKRFAKYVDNELHIEIDENRPLVFKGSKNGIEMKMILAPRVRYD